MIITSDQIRAGRTLLRWSAQWLAMDAGVHLATVQRMEKTHYPIQANTESVRKVHQSLELAGIEFVFENGDGVGVKLRKPIVSLPRKEQWNSELERMEFSAIINYDREILCWISNKTIERRIKSNGTHDPIGVFEGMYDEMELITRQKIQKEEFEDDGTIQIKEFDRRG